MQIEDEETSEAISVVVQSKCADEDCLYKCIQVAELFLLAVPGSAGFGFESQIYSNYNWWLAPCLCSWVSSKW